MLATPSSYNPGSELGSLPFESLIGGPLVAVVNAQSQAAMSSVDFIQKVGFTEDKEPIYVSFKYPKLIAPFQPGNQGQVVTVTINNGGSGYTSAPAVAITGGGGSGATATANISDGSVVSITILASGNGYTSVPSVSLSGGGGTGASAAAALGGTPPSPAQFQEMKLEVPILTMLPIPFIRIDLATVDFNAKINSVETKNIETEFGIKGDLTLKQRWPGGSAKLNVSASYKRKTTQGSTVEKTYSMAVSVRAVQDEMPAGLERLLGILEDAIISTPQTDSTPETDN